MAIAPIIRAVSVTCPPMQAFEIFTERIGAWWPLSTHGIFGARSAGVAFVADQLIERSLDGDEAVWGTVTAWRAPYYLAFTWAPGAATGPATGVAVRFLGDGRGTLVELDHGGWDVLAEGAAEAHDAYVGPTAWGYVLDHYCDVAARVAAPLDLSHLEASYEAFFQEALTDDFTDPAGGEWSAAQIVAHVALNDDNLAAVCRAIIDDRPSVLDNALVTDPAMLERFIGDRTMAELVEVAWDRSLQVRTLVSRLDEAQLDREIHCRFVDGGELVVDGPMPWRRVVLQIQPDYHLPGHTEQLTALRATSRVAEA